LYSISGSIILIEAGISMDFILHDSKALVMILSNCEGSPEVPPSSNSILLIFAPTNALEEISRTELGIRKIPFNPALANSFVAIKYLLGKVG
jgi:hypothetical protein